MDHKIKYFDNRKDWRKWLFGHYAVADEIWFVFPDDIVDRLKNDETVWKNYRLKYRKLRKEKEQWVTIKKRAKFFRLLWITSFSKTQ